MSTPAPISVTLQTTEGGSVSLRSQMEDEEELLRLVTNSGLDLDPLPEDEAEMDIENLEKEIAGYTREITGAKNIPGPDFELCGRIGAVSFWVFSVPFEEEPLYAFLVRERCFAELGALPMDAELEDGSLVRLSPAEAAAIEFCLRDPAPTDIVP